MERQTLINEVRETLAKSGFYVSDECSALSFDFVSRRDNLLLLVKVLVNVDSFSRSAANELKTLSTFLEGSSIIVGKKTGSGEIEEDVIYLRHGIPIISAKTLENTLLEGSPPFVYAAPGGFYVNIDGGVIKKMREKRKISLGILSEIAGVSRRAIQMYEDGMSAMVDVASRLEESLDESIVLPLDLFSYTSDDEKTFQDEQGSLPRRDAAQFPERMNKNSFFSYNELTIKAFDDFEKDVFTMLNRIGYRVVPVMKCPFNALTKDKKTLILTGVEKYNKRLAKKAGAVMNISKVTEKHSVFFVKSSEKQNLCGVPLIKISELKKADDPESIVQLILERKKG